VSRTLRYDLGELSGIQEDFVSTAKTSAATDGCSDTATGSIAGISDSADIAIDSASQPWVSEAGYRS
jgi:hypothetical protein